jgi:hypothetical protein
MNSSWMNESSSRLRSASELTSDWHAGPAGATMPAMDQERAQSRSLDDPDEHRELPRAEMDVVRLGDLLAVRATFQPGWRWSTDMGPRMGTTSCPVTHRGILLAGRMRVEMDSGEIVDVAPGSIQVIPAGHDAFVVGDEAAVMVDFSTSAAGFAVAS